MKLKNFSRSILTTLTKSQKRSANHKHQDLFGTFLRIVSTKEGGGGESANKRPPNFRSPYFTQPS
jgi:hypothetical protein